jgi:predicted permease
MPRWVHVIRARLQSLFLRRRLDDQVAADVEFHLEEASAEYRRRGLSAEEARHAALREFGGVMRARERLSQDVRYGLRTFRRNPGFALTAILSLALGIGATTAVFTIVNAMLLRPLPVHHPEQLVLINPRSDFSYPHYVALRDGVRLFSDLVAASRANPVVLDVGAAGEQASIKIVSGNYFTGLGVPAARGRVLTSADDRDRVAVISRGYWSRQFGDSPDVVGRSIHLQGLPFTIVGVIDGSFVTEAPGDAPDIWTSIAFQLAARRDERGYSWLNLIGRLKPGTTPQQAEAEVNAVATGLSLGFAHLEVAPGSQGIAGLRYTFSDPLLILLAIAFLVLLIACTNLGSLLLTRAAARESEMAMRLAIGASRVRIIRQLMTESLMLALAGGLIGSVFAVWGSGALLRLASSAGRAIVLDLTPDVRVLLFTAGASLAAAAVFGLVPAVRTVSTAASLGRGAHRVVGRSQRWSLRDAFIVVQLALSVMLLAGTAMFTRTVQNLEHQDLGFDVDAVLLVEMQPARGYRPTIATLVPRLLERAQGIAGVSAASVVFNGPLGGGSGVNGLEVDGFTPQTPQDQRARADWVGPSYFATVGIPIMSGRDFTFADDTSGPRVAVVNQTMARHYFRDGAALGRRFTFNKNHYEIVGIARDAKYTDLRDAVPRMIYFPLLQGGAGPNGWVLRAPGVAPSALAGAVRAAIRDVDPRLSAGDITTLSARLRRTLIREHLLSDLAGFFAGLTLLLASIGVYGTLAYTAAMRTKEIGIRLALGSRRAAVIWIVLRAIVVRVAIGLVLGFAGIVATGRLVASMLFGLTPTDPVTIGLSALTLIAVALLAGYLPALRASRLDPASVLRE